MHRPAWLMSIPRVAITICLHLTIYSQLGNGFAVVSSDLVPLPPFFKESRDMNFDLTDKCYFVNALTGTKWEIDFTNGQTGPDGKVIYDQTPYLRTDKVVKDTGLPKRKLIFFWQDQSKIKGMSDDDNFINRALATAKMPRPVLIGVPNPIDPTKFTLIPPKVESLMPVLFFDSSQGKFAYATCSVDTDVVKQDGKKFPTQKDWLQVRCAGEVHAVN